MRRLPSLLAALLFSSIAFAQVPHVELTVTETGINGENLQDTPVTDAINMLASPAGGSSSLRTNQLALTLNITPGTTATITVFCSESESSTVNTMAKINRCPGGTCTPDVRTYTLSDFATVSGKKYITARWHVTKKYAACTLDDAANGSGTVIVTGTRSLQ